MLNFGGGSQLQIRWNVSAGDCIKSWRCKATNVVLGGGLGRPRTYAVYIWGDLNLQGNNSDFCWWFPIQTSSFHSSASFRSAEKKQHLPEKKKHPCHHNLHLFYFHTRHEAATNTTTTTSRRSNNSNKKKKKKKRKKKKTIKDNKQPRAPSLRWWWCSRAMLQDCCLYCSPCGCLAWLFPGAFTSISMAGRWDRAILLPQPRMQLAWEGTFFYSLILVGILASMFFVLFTTIYSFYVDSHLFQKGDPTTI